MFYEDFRIGQSGDLGQTIFSREAILGFGRRFDPRVLRAAVEGAPLIASGLHVAAAGMRRLIEARSALRSEMVARGEALPEMGVSPGFKDLRWGRPVREDDTVLYSFETISNLYSFETISKRETSKPKWGLVGNRFRGVNHRGEEVLVFSSVVLVARRAGEP
jgi:acyl dehydratase